jgi:hypothetical protein
MDRPIDPSIRANLSSATPQPEVQAASHSRATTPREELGSRFTSEPCRTHPEDSSSLQVPSTSNKRPVHGRQLYPVQTPLWIGLPTGFCYLSATERRLTMAKATTVRNAKEHTHSNHRPNRL